MRQEFNFISDSGEVFQVECCGRSIHGDYENENDVYEVVVADENDNVVVDFRRGKYFTKEVDDDTVEEILDACYSQNFSEEA